MSDEVKKVYWSSTQIAKVLSVKPTMIRFWQVQFEIETNKNKHGDRLYTGDDVGTLVMIARLVKHFHIKSAKEAIRKGVALQLLDILEPDVKEPVL